MILKETNSWKSNFHSLLKVVGSVLFVIIFYCKHIDIHIYSPDGIYSSSFKGMKHSNIPLPYNNTLQNILRFYHKRKSILFISWLSAQKSVRFLCVARYRLLFPYEDVVMTLLCFLLVLCVAREPS